MLHYLWEYHKNPACCTLHVDAELPECPHYGEPKTEDALAFRGRIKAIPGVISMSVSDRYKINITRGLAFDWAAVQAAVLAQARDFLGSVADEAEEIPAIHPEPERRSGLLGNYLWS